MPLGNDVKAIRLLIILIPLIYVSCGSPAGPSNEYYVKNRIAFSSDINGNLDLYTVKLDGTGLVRVTDCEKDDYDIASRPAWSPDGRHIAFTMSHASPQDGAGPLKAISFDLFYITPKGSHQKPLLTEFPISSFCWNNNSEEINVLRSVITPTKRFLDMFSLNIDNMEFNHLAELKDISYSLDSASSMDWSVNGELVFTWLSKIYLKVALEDTTSIELAEGLYPKWSPDGNKIVYVVDDQIWIMNRDGGEKELLIQEGKHPDWSPDGQKIVFSGKNDNKYNISYYNLMTGTIISVIDNGYNNIKPVFSPL
ncbi:TolB family protein [candidate division KSB1 bacterium]